MDCHGLSGIEQDGVEQRQTGNGMAAPAVLIGCWRLTSKTSVHGANNMLGLAKRVKPRILQASTSEVYGDPEIKRDSGGLSR
jgi:nucleoside-diphosphate-sugar epimerase